MNRLMIRWLPLVVLLLAGLCGGSALAITLPDLYVGDTAIYSGNTEENKANVLFAVDNTAGMAQQGSRQPFNPSLTYSTSGGYDTLTVYERKTATGGTVNYVAYIDDDDGDGVVAGDEVSCAEAADALTNTGFYAGPLKKSNGTCTAPQPGNYFTGNLLNYINSPVGAADWSAATEYAVGDLIRVLVGTDNRIFRVTTAGTSGDTVPSWPSATGATVTDGTVVWTLISGSWEASNAYAVGDMILVTIGGQEVLLEAVAAGTSGASEPDWDSVTCWPYHENPSADACDTSAASTYVVWDQPGSIIEMVRATLKLVAAGARQTVKMGLITFGNNAFGGQILAEAKDISTASTTTGNNYDGLVAAIEGFDLETGNSDQPVNELLHDAGLYFQGSSAWGSSERIGTNGPDAVSSPATPIENSCQKNYVILLTTGSVDIDNHTKSTDALGDDLTGDGAEGLADDASNWLNGLDIAYASGEVNDEGVQTHVIQLLTPRVSRLESTAQQGDGEYYKVNNSIELTEALIDAMAAIVLSTDTSFVAPVVPTSPENRTYSGQRVYLGFFEPVTQEPWRGNLKKYGISLSNAIIDKDDDPATDASGNFLHDAKSYWNDVEDAGEVDHGGAGEVLLNRNFVPSTAGDLTTATDPRKIYTYDASAATTDLTNSAHAFDFANTGFVTAANLGVSTAAERAAVIGYLHGLDVKDEDGDGVTNEKRGWILGDILHSKPKVINYNHFTFSKTNEADCTTNKGMIYVGANDGMLHAFRDCDGREMWSFVPPDLLSDLQSLINDVRHHFFVDGTPTAYIYDADQDGDIESGDKVMLIFGLRRGGVSYYALDVTDPVTPKFMWKIDPTTTGFGELGQTWSTPMLGKVQHTVSGTTYNKIVAFVGAGYDNDNEDGRFGSTHGYTNADVVIPTDDDGSVTSTGSTVRPRDDASDTITNDPRGRGVFAIEIATLDNSGVPDFTNSGSLVWEFQYAGLDNTYNRRRMKFSVPADITAVDTDFDGYTDRLYAPDTGGQLWRISQYYTSGELRPYAEKVINQWFGKRIFEANAAGDDADAWGTLAGGVGRKFFYRPSITFEKDGSYRLYIGSGDRAHPLNTAVTDRLYGLIDRGQRTNEHTAADDLVDLTENYLQVASPVADPATCPTNPADTGYDSIQCTLARLNDAALYGWYIDLDQHPGEKVLANPLAFNKVAYYTTYAPDTSVTPNPCEPGNLGTSRLYAVDYHTGEAVLNFDKTNDSESTTGNDRALSDSEKVLRRSDREIDLGVGIPSGIVVLMPPDGDAKLLIGCGGGLCTEDPKVGGTIIPIYWMQW